MFDQVILTSCDEETQITRGMKRDHATREQVLARMENSCRSMRNSGTLIT